MIKPVIGVLALQGAVEPHKPHIEAAGGEFRAVKTPEQFEQVDAFILPGGESTTMLKLIDAFGLWEPLQKQFAQKPVWGICAGSILIAEKVLNPSQKSFGLLPIIVERNAYGRQLDSRHGEVNGYPVSFIRAPVILPSLPPRERGGSEARGGDLEILATHEGTPVWVRKGPYMATTFHAELTLDFPSPMHRECVTLAREKTKNKVA